jgi:hypothetical protein
MEQLRIAKDGAIPQCFDPDKIFYNKDWEILITDGCYTRKTDKGYALVGGLKDDIWRFIGWPTHISAHAAKNRVAFAMCLWFLFKVSGTTIAEYYSWCEKRS